MKTIALLPLIAWLLSGSLALGAEQPNIILIFADDLGWKDVGFQGSDFMETPNLDRLAGQGMVFTSAYAAAGNCAPSRACLLSGMYTPRHHVYAVGSTDRGNKAAQRLIPIPNRDGLAAEVVTVAEALRGAGYVTGHFGKWHLAGKQGALPTRQGFDVSFDSFGEKPLPEGSEGNQTGPPTDPKGVFTLTRKACEFIEENRARPFFCYLAHHAIHTPLQTRPESLDKFKNKAPGTQHHNAKYAACTYDLDASVGVLLDKLEELDLSQKTLIVFTSDNGATQQSSQEPLRGNKGSYYEGGIREPFIARWPGVIQPGSRCDVPVISIDLYPTFLDVASAPTPREAPRDGESLLPLFRGQPRLNREAIFWHFPGYLNTPVTRGRELDVRTGFRSRPVSVIRKGDWKLHLYHEEWQLDGGRERLGDNNAVELYHLSQDIGEHHNLAATELRKRDELLDDLLAWQQATGATMPAEPNPNYQPETQEKAVESVAQTKSLGSTSATIRPNILFAIADDWGYPDASAYGTPVIATPTFDRLAAEGVLFRQAFVSSPSCTPSRGAMLTGKFHWSLKGAANLWSVFPDEFATYPEILQSAGYFTGHEGKSWGPGRPATPGRQLAGKRFADFETFLTARPKDQPFFYWLGTDDPHRPYQAGSGQAAGMDLSAIAVPACLPDSPTVRGDLADYYLEVQRFDALMGKALATLEASGELERTIIVMTSDHGMPFPRGKSNLYDTGTRVPLAIRYGSAIPAGREVQDFVSLVDLAPLFLQLAGQPFPADDYRAERGRRLWEILSSAKSGYVAAPESQWIVFGKERHVPAQEAPDMGGYPSRALRTADYLLIHNYRPDRWPNGTPNHEKSVLRRAWFADTDNGPSKSYLIENQNRDELHRALFAAAFAKRPEFELYDLKHDPNQLTNVAERAEYQAALAELRTRLDEQLRRTGDPRATGEAIDFDEYPYLGAAPIFPEKGKK